MTNIEIYRKFDNPIDPSLLEMEISNQNFSQFLSDNDKVIIEREWAKVKSENPKAFYNENGNGSLHNTINNILTFLPTDFHVYVAGPRTSANWEMSQNFYGNMRIASIGAAVRGKDGRLCVIKDLQEKHMSLMLGIRLWQVLLEPEKTAMALQ